MVFMGMYPNKYIGGNPFMLNGIGGGLLYGGVHPSLISNGGLNYFSGNVTSPIGTQIPALNPQVQPQNQVQVQNNDGFYPQTDAAKIQNLQSALDGAKNEQGIVGKFWDGIKGATGLGLSGKKCQNYINSVKSGQMSYEEALGKIGKYKSKQTGAVNMLSGIASGTLGALAIGLAVPTGGLSLGALFTAGAVGAGAKAGIKTLDRATNNVENDAFDAKKIIKDGLSGALNGVVTASTMGIGKDVLLTSGSAKEALKQGALAGAKGGAIAGAAQGAGDYTIECAFEENQKFEADELIQNTAYSAIAGGITGAVTGGITAHARFNKFNPDTGAGGGSNPVNPSGDNGTIYIGPNDYEIIEPSGPKVLGQQPVQQQTIIDADFVEIPAGTSNPAGVKPVAAETPVVKTEPLGLPAPKNEPDISIITGGSKKNNFIPDGAAGNQTLIVPDTKQPAGLLPSGTENVSLLPAGQNSGTGEIIPLPGPSSESGAVVVPEISVGETGASSGAGQVDPLKENLARLIHSKKNPEIPSSAASDNLKENAAGLIHGVKQSKLAKLKAFFGHKE